MTKDVHHNAKMYEPKLTQEQIDSFWFRVDRRNPDECWNWTKGLNGKDRLSNYGVVWFNGTRHKCHRIAKFLSTGPFDDGKLVCHTCDNPQCCNPSHLFLGSHRDNALDCKAKGRLHRECGSARYNARLTEEQVAEIKAMAPFRKYGWGREMAKKYGVGPTAINNIIRGRRWRQVGQNTPIEAISSPHVH